MLWSWTMKTLNLLKTTNLRIRMPSNCRHSSQRLPESSSWPCSSSSRPWCSWSTCSSCFTAASAPEITPNGERLGKVRTDINQTSTPRWDSNKLYATSDFQKKNLLADRPRICANCCGGSSAWNRMFGYEWNWKFGRQPLSGRQNQHLGFVFGREASFHWKRQVRQRFISFTHIFNGIFGTWSLAHIAHSFKIIFIQSKYFLTSTNSLVAEFGDLQFGSLLKIPTKVARSLIPQTKGDPFFSQHSKSCSKAPAQIFSLLKFEWSKWG